MTESLNNGTSKTTKGNIKMPPYLKVSEWVKMWAKAQTEEKVGKTFTLCGLVPPEMFDVTKLHQPLQDCFGEMDDETGSQVTEM